MKLLLSLCLIWVLVNTAEAIHCLLCKDYPECREVFSYSCSSDMLCSTRHVKLQVMGISSLHVDKVCVSTSKCIVGTANYSIHLGSMRVVAAVECCDADFCNSATPAIPAEPKNNSLQCYSCDSFTCRNKMQCVGMEDRCFNGTAYTWITRAHTFGCASSNLCEGFSELDSMIIPGFNFTDGPTCCEGNFCNSVSTTRLSVFPLLLGLISLIFIY
ncbi:uncharacterized protein LOC115377920 isoform X3 [Myripristis murdjan]|uniref:uncharacterized protein LOC115377920 isoform X3 n=1 Tax=Myripristis murdjan TaxID=586833 RepID=UPI001175DAFD|nr:uncharacterized protein LOC115377920 isoform X3 [Myripristis murdjan]